MCDPRTLLGVLPLAVMVAIGCATKPTAPPNPGTSVDTTAKGDTADTTTLPQGFVPAVGHLSYAFDTLKSPAAPPAPPAWVCLPSGGTLNDSVALSIRDTTAGSATLIALGCEADADSVAGPTLLLIEDTTAVPMDANSYMGDYGFGLYWHAAHLALSGRWTDAGDTTMTGISATLTLPDGHILSGNWSGRHE